MVVGGGVGREMQRSYDGKRERESSVDAACYIG
jgi:hypothetical protein